MKKQIKYLILLFCSIVLITNAHCFNQISAYAKANSDVSSTYQIKDISSLNTSNERAYVIDNSAFLTTEQVKELSDKLIYENNKNNFDIVILTVNTIGDKDLTTFSENFYDSNGYRPDGILLVIDTENHGWHVTTTGSAIKLFPSRQIDDMMKDVVAELSTDNNYAAFCTFIEKILTDL